MRRPRGCASAGGQGLCRSLRGALTTYLAVLLPVLLLFFLLLYDLGTLIHAQVQARTAATAAAISAVGHQRHWPIAIPTKFVWAGNFPIPIDGLLINALTVPEVRGGQLAGTSADLAQQNGADAVRVQEYPWDGISPVVYLKVTAEVRPKGLLSRIVHPQPVTSTACSVAWVRPDYWVLNGWWTDESRDVIDAVFSGEDDPHREPLRYYRLIRCDENLTDALRLFEVIATEYLEQEEANRSSRSF